MTQGAEQHGTASEVLASVGLGRADIYDAFLSKKGADLILAFIRTLFARKLHPEEAPRDLLDVGCGTGRMLGPLSELDVRVVGVDPDADYLSRARERTAGLERVELESGGFLELDHHEAFDACVAINGPIYYLREPEERALALRNVFRALRPGGIVLLDLANLLYLLRYGRRELQPEERLINGKRIVRKPQHELDFDKALWIHHDEILIETGLRAQTYRESYAFAIIPPPELRAALAAAGFSDIESYNGWYDPFPSRLDGARIVMSARRPK